MWAPSFVIIQLVSSASLNKALVLNCCVCFGSIKISETQGVDLCIAAKDVINYYSLPYHVFCTLRKFTKEKRNLCNCYSPPEKILLWVDFSFVPLLRPTIKSRKWASEFCYSYKTSPRNLGFEKNLIQGAESNIGRSLVVLWPGCRCHTSYTNFLRH